MTTTTTITLTDGTTDVPALMATPGQAAALLFTLAGVTTDETAEVWTCGFDGSPVRETGLLTVGQLATLIDDGHPWLLVPDADNHDAPALWRQGPDDAAGVWVAVIAD